MMNDKLKYLLLIDLFFFMACGKRKVVEKTEQETRLIFSKGKRVSNGNFTGTVYLYTMVEGDSLNTNSVGNVTFEPGARSKWHSHPAGQILLATDGVGYYQEKGKSKIILHKGDVVKCLPNVAHWHGASADTAFVQVAITGREKGPTVWFEAVSEAVYLAEEK